MNPIAYIRSLFSRTPKQGSTRSYREIVSVGGVNSDWTVAQISEDADVWQNAYMLTSRMRDLFKCNPTFIKYRETLLSDVFGEQGITLRMKIKETEDRVVHTADEKAALVAHEQRINRVRQWAAQKTGNAAEQYRAFMLAEHLEKRSLEDVIRGKAMIQVGAPDVFANQLIERKWKEWQRAEFCDVRGRRNYHVLRHLRLISAVRDGDFFIRKVVGPAVNKFGLTLQLINAEWCDRFYNATLDNGNEVRMGIEYQSTPWGIGKMVAFHFIKRQPRDWQFSVPGMFNFTQQGKLHERIDASEIIHYARAVDADGTRPAPWAASTIPKARQLNEYEIAEVVAAREQACKIGHYYSDMLPEGGSLPVDPMTGFQVQEMGPGDKRSLPYGVKYQQDDPTHPNGNFEAFRKGMLRSLTSGMPGADYNRLASDLENINFSAGRLGRLDTNETSKLLQRFDIDTAEVPIFEAFLEWGLITGEIPLPLAKMQKFNKPNFQGRRWEQVDEVKAGAAAAIRIANKLSSRSKECDERGIDFEDNAFELAEEEMLLETLGLRQETTAQTPLPSTGADDASADNTDAAATGSIQAAALNGAQIIALIEIVGKITSGEISFEAGTALISASFPLMTDEEITAIISNLTVSKLSEEEDEEPEEKPAKSPVAGKNGNGKHLANGNRFKL